MRMFFKMLRRMFFKMLRRVSRRFRGLGTQKASDGGIEVIRHLSKDSEIRGNTLDNARGCSKNGRNHSVHMVFAFFRRRCNFLTGLFGEKRCFGRGFLRLLHKSCRPESLSDEAFPSVGYHTEDNHCCNKGFEKRENETKATKNRSGTVTNRSVHMVVSFFHRRSRCSKGFFGKKFPLSNPLRIASVLIFMHPKRSSWRRSETDLAAKKNSTLPLSPTKKPWHSGKVRSCIIILGKHMRACPSRVMHWHVF